MSGEIRLGRYVLGPLLGTGGRGRVYRADLLGPGGFRKTVALKVLIHDPGSEELVQEARLGGLLRHPNLVEVYDLGRATWEPGPPDGLPDEPAWYCAMELVAGGSLAGARLDGDQAAEVARQVCEGLLFAHREIGLVHCDLKPENLLIEGSVVKVADLGIALSRGQSRARGGTAGFMAPEQESGGAVGPWTDVYALGRVIRELVGDRPLPPALDAVIARCLAVDPRARWPGMDALGAALAALAPTRPALSLGTPAPSGVPVHTFTFTEPVEQTTRVPAPLDRFVGREADAALLTEQLESHGLVTLKGPGGTGKTRLAVEVARAWPGPSWLCDASSCRTGEDLILAAAEALGLPPAATPEAISRAVGEALRERRDGILILDNLEQIPDAGRAIRPWLPDRQRARLLVTSRVPLQLAGERVVELAPLPADEAVALLLERSGLERSSPELEELAGRLDGLPLALELAAARLRLLSPTQVLQRLDLQILQGRRGDRPDRQRTLIATLDWSWELLSHAERAALPQLAVFRGGFTLDDAEAVLALPDGAPWVVDVIEGLLNNSMIRVRPGDEPRFDLFETVRLWALGRLEDPERARERHAEHQAQLADDNVQKALARGGVAWMHRLAAERDNLLEAIAWLREQDRFDEAARCAIALSRLSGHLLPLSVGLAVLGQALEPSPGLDVRARVLAQRVYSCIRAGDFPGARAAAAEAERCIEATGDPTLAVEVRLAVLAVQVVLGASEELADQQRQLAIDAEAVGAVGIQAHAYGNLGLTLHDLGRFDESHAAFDAGAALHRARGDVVGLGTVLGNKGNAWAEQGHLDRARASWEAALALHQQVDPGGFFVGQMLISLAGGASELGEHERMLTLVPRIRELVARAGDRRSLGQLGEYLAKSLQGRGDLEGADREHATAIEIMDQCGDALFAGAFRVERGLLAAERRDRALVARMIAEANATARGKQAVVDTMLTLLEAEAAAMDGDSERVRERLDSAGAVGRSLVGLQTLLVRARLLRDVEALDRAREWATELGLFGPTSLSRIAWERARNAIEAGC